MLTAPLVSTNASCAAWQKRKTFKNAKYFVVNFTRYEAINGNIFLHYLTK